MTRLYSVTELPDGSLMFEEKREKRHCCPECGREGMIMFSVKSFPMYRGSCVCGWNSGRYENIIDVEKLMPFAVPVRDHEDTATDGS